MADEKEVINEYDSKVQAFNLKVKNIKKIKDFAIDKFEGNKSKAVNKIVEEF